MLHGLRLAVTLVGKNSLGVFQHLADNVLKPSKECKRGLCCGVSGSARQNSSRGLPTVKTQVRADLCIA